MSFNIYRNPREFFDEDSTSTESISSIDEDNYTTNNIMENLQKDFNELKELVLTLATNFNTLQNKQTLTESNSVISEDRSIAGRIEQENGPSAPLIPSEPQRINFEEEDKISRFLWNATKHLPEFDNWSASVKSFISEVEEISRQIPREYHARFVKLVKSHRIRANEKRLLDGYNITGVEDFISILRMQFGEYKTFDVVQTERSFCLQKPNEPVLEYNKRFMGCQIALERAINNKCNMTPEQKQYVLIHERQTGLMLYLSGLLVINPSLHDF
ncbi:hypothetical protein KPH14_012885 [Odynerus spinipes]|uniref:Retrotransposon gag domain-containing protein n=1 Tax=Odynerus spinipes TaxID=1348599 RepID=A0AAD9RD99_9HYME|nr:hypothetical protein KPH14_012885 [Odynerus spinipes]